MKSKDSKIIQMEGSDFQILKEILMRYPYKFYAYGSRARWEASRYSDIDIFCKEKIKDSDLTDLGTDLDESNLTIKIDILDAQNCSEEFRKAIRKDLIEIK